MLFELGSSGMESIDLQVIPNAQYDSYVERVVDSSRYWVLKIATCPSLSRLQQLSLSC